MQFEPGMQYENLLIEEELGRGSFATVFRARDTLVNRPVALKVLRPALTTASVAIDRERLLREARIIGALRSPHVVTLYGVREIDADTLLLELELVDGGTLEERLVEEDGPIPRHEIVRILRGILSGLDAAHRQGVLHRDIKPANVLLDRQGEVKLTDFGLGVSLGELSLAHSLPGGGGTPHYMAPESMMKDRATAATDLWALGVMLYRMLAGRLPFPATELPSLFHSVLHGEPRPFPAGAPADLCGLAIRCLSKHPDNRPASCAEMLDALDAMERSTSTSPPSLREESRSLLPLLGRHEELTRLEDIATEAAAGQTHTILVTGDGGIGKSRLLEEFRLRTAARGFDWLVANVTPVGGLGAALLEGARHLMQGDDAESHVMPEIDEATFGPAAGIIDRLLQAPTSDNLQDLRRLQWALEQLCMGLARSHPLGILVEDGRHGGAGDFQLLRGLIAGLGGAPVVICLAVRLHDGKAAAEPTFLAGVLAELAALPGAHRFELGPLPSTAISELIEREAGAAVPEPMVAAEIVRRSGGNPLYALELYRHVTEGELTEGRDKDLPPKIRDVFLARLDRLPPEDRTLLEAAAIDGLTFDGQALAAVLGWDLLAVLRTLQRLCRDRGLVLPLQRGFRFAHSLLQEVLYADLAPEFRREMHRRLAVHLESRDRGDLVDAERMGLHWERAGNALRAAPYLRRAARKAAARQEYARALDLAEHAGLLPGPTTPEETRDEADLLFALSGSLSDLARHEEAHTLVRRVHDAAQTLDDAELARRAVVWEQDLTHYHRGASAVDQRALRDATTLVKSPVERVRGHHILGRTALNKGELDLARVELEDALAVSKEHDLVALAATMHQDLGTIAETEGRRNEALDHFEEAYKLSEVAGKPVNAAISRIHRAMVALQTQADPLIVTSLTQAVRALHLAGSEGKSGLARVYLARAQTAVGALGDAEHVLAEAASILQRLEAVGPLAEVQLERAQLEGIQGRLQDASRSLDDAADATQHAGATFLRPFVLAERTRLACWAGHPEKGLASAREALATSQPYGAQAVALTALRVLEAHMFGLSSAILEDVDAALGDTDAQVPTIQLAKTLLAASRALDEKRRGAAALRAGANALRSPLWGERHAERDLLAGLFAATADRRSGGPLDARDRLRRVGRRAGRLGHVWIEAACAALEADDQTTLREVPTALGDTLASLPDLDATTDIRTAWREGRAVRPFPDAMPDQ